MNRGILGVALLSLAFAAACLGEESEDGGEELEPTQDPWEDHKGPHKHHYGPHGKHEFQACPMIPECRSELKQLLKHALKSKETKVCKEQFIGCMKNVRDTESSKIAFPEDCLNGVKNMFHLN